MKKPAVLLVLAAFSFLPLLGLGAESFRIEGNAYLAEGEALAAQESAALEAAREAALRALLGGSGKDELFAEILIREPPAGLSFTTSALVAVSGGFRAKVELRVDDESLRIIERGPYLQAALALLNDAEKALGEAEELLPAAEEAENAFRLGEASGRYGQVFDRSEAGLGLLAPLRSSSIYSSAGGRSLIDLRAGLSAIRERSSRGLGRVEESQAILARDERSRNLGQAVEMALAEVERAQVLLDEERPLLSDPTAQGPELLIPLRDRLTRGRAALGDASSVLESAGKDLPPDAGFLSDKLEFARRRLSSSGEALASAYRAVDREIRNPAARRAARAEAFASIFLHQAREYVQFRAYLPLSLGLGEAEGLSYPADFEARARIEGALGRSGGAWVRLGLERQAPALFPGAEPSLAQDFDFGLWRKSLFWLGYGWDWLPDFQGRGLAGIGELRVGIGGVSSREKDYSRLDWLLGFSFELPEALPESLEDGFSWRYLNGGLEALFRLGSFAILEGELSARARENGSEESFGLLGYRLGLGFRLPSPFLWGLELRGAKSWALGEDWGIEGEGLAEELDFRFYLEYDI